MPNSPICVDASVVVRLVVPIGESAALERWDQWSTEGRQLIGPTLLYYEVCNALYQYQRIGDVSADAVRTALRATQSLPIKLIGDPRLHIAALELADQYGLNAAYDAHYLALARRESAEFWTADRRLCRQVQERLPWVNLLA